MLLQPPIASTFNVAVDAIQLENDSITASHAMITLSLIDSKYFAFRMVPKKLCHPAKEIPCPERSSFNTLNEGLGKMLIVQSLIL